MVRLRVSSLQPQEITSEMLGLWADRRLCPHFHLPLQSGSDAVLKRMRRRYTADLYSRTVETIWQSIPDVSITADVIVGFPGETDTDFQQSYTVCERAGFADMHVFPYSVRPGTSAAHYGGQLSPETKAGRARALLELTERQCGQFRGRFLGKVRSVLWEGPAEARGSNQWSGLTDNYIRVLGRSHRSLANQVTMARLTTQREDMVFAQVI